MTHPDGTFDAYTFNYSGRLIQKVQSGVTIRYAYSTGPAPLAEYNVNTGQWTNHIMANGRIWAMETGNQVKYLHHDAIGNVVAISDSSGTVTDNFVYDPFGKLLSHTGTTQTDYGFVGSYGVRNMPDGMMLMGRHLYDPTAGRFTTPDPMGYRGGDLNFYRYCGNRPLRSIDPYGLYSWDEFLEDAISVVDVAANVSAGFGDTITSGFGLSDTSLTEMAREALDVNTNVVNQYSDTYSAGQTGADVWAGTTLVASAAAASGYQVAIRLYPNIGGGGISLLAGGKRLLGADWHDIVVDAEERFLLHLHFPGSGKHWPWGG